MKKLKHSLILTLICTFSALFFNGLKPHIQAESSTTIENISETTTITGDITHTDKTFNIDDNISNAFIVNTGAKLTLINCEIKQNTSGAIDSLFVVNEGAELYLDNVSFSNFTKYTYAILNYGKIYINNTDFLEEYTSVYNEPTNNENSFIYESGDLHKVKLINSYITITENTLIENNIDIITANDPTTTPTNKQLLVKGMTENVFASRYINKFTYAGGNNDGSDEDLLPWYIDYIGDIESEESITTDITDEVCNATLQSGDIILTQQNLSFKFKQNGENVFVSHSSDYCTSYSYFKTNPTILYYSSSLTRTLNNFSANLPNSAPSVSVWSKDSTTNVTINTKKTDSDTNYSQTTVSYPSGANWAVFVDIPSNHTLKETKYYNGSTEISKGEIISVRDNLFANANYMRPIIDFNSELTSPTSYNLTIDFIFEPNTQSPTIKVNSIHNFELEPQEENIVAGQSYTFEILKKENIKVTSIIFNGNKVEFTEDTDSYTFTATIKEDNLITINSIAIPYTITVSPNPTQTSFEYLEEIVLQENYTVEETGDVITITYSAPDTPLDVGTYNITSATSSNPDYIIEIAHGTFTYEITQKEIRLDEIESVRVTKSYTTNLINELSVNLFIPELPNYLDAELILEDVDFVAGLQYLDATFTITNNNYKLFDTPPTKQVELFIPPATIDVNSSNGLELIQPEELMLPGNNYTFEISKKENVKVTSIIFNDHAIAFTVGTDSYIFTATVKQENDITINSITLPHTIIISPNPIQTKFEYLEEIVLQESYTVEATGEVITITYHTPTTPLDVGTYNITSAVSSNSNYIIEIAEGSFTYEITAKEVDLDGIESVRVTKTYSTNLKTELTVNLFISNIPSYLRAELNLQNVDFVAGLQYLDVTFSITNNNYKLSETTPIKQVELFISPATIDTSSYNLLSSSFVYNAQEYTPTIENLDSNLVNVEYEYYLILDDKKTIVNSIINAGEYEIIATLSSKNSLYSLDKDKLTSSITISKADINMTEYTTAVSTFVFEYDKQEHNIDLKQSLLPANVQIKEISSTETHINAGTYEYTIYFNYDTNNYNCLNSTISTLEITPREIGVTLKKSSFDYTGLAPIIEPILSNVLDGDVVNLTLGNINNVDADTYVITIDDIDNANYKVASDITLSYTINPIVFSLKNIVYEDKPVTFDGNAHLPVIEGDFPEGIVYTIDNVICRNVGTYLVKCKFTSSNTNYIAPEPITAKVIIEPRPIEVVFVNPDSMLANGLPKEVTVYFTNTIEGEEVAYRKTYSATPTNAGTYTCYVELQSKSNYTIVNAKSYDFTILSDTLRFFDEKISVLVKGRFSGEDDLTIKHTTNDAKIINKMNTMDIKSYTSINLSYTTFSTESVNVSIPSDDVTTNVKHLKIYKFQNGELTPIEYTVDNNLITFSISSGGDLIFVEEHSSLYKNRFLIIGLSILGVVCLTAGTVTPIVLYKKKLVK